jgi:hypothetical protein
LARWAVVEIYPTRVDMKNAIFPTRIREK